MKKIGCISILIWLSIFKLFAQPSTTLKENNIDGIYITMNDYKKNILSDMKNEDDNTKFKISTYSLSPKISFIKGNMKKTFLADSIFAVHLSNGESYRFINDIPCCIEDTTYLFIYHMVTTKTVFKEYGPHRLGNKTTMNAFYFSFGDHKQVFPLTLESFSLFPNFYRIVCDEFKDDSALQMVNPQSGQFKVNEILSKAFK